MTGPAARRDVDQAAAERKPVTAKIAIIGTGYVGLTTGACFAHLGHQVVCADLDPVKVERLNRGDVPILEAGLDELVSEGLRSGLLRFVLGAEHAAADCEFAYLCVETPQAADGSADLSFIEAAARQISPVLPTEAVVINKSTVPVGSTRVVEQALQRSDVAVVSNPEFLREGSAVHDFLHPDRIIIGSEDQASAIRVASLYIGLAAPLMVTDPASAETIKYASNAFLATKISFVNAVAAVCEAVGADVNDVVLGMGYDKRIGHEFLRPGPGWGGSCFPKDSRALVAIAEGAGYDFDLLKGVITVNNEQFGRVADSIEAMAGGSVDGKVVAAWGLTFKARTDDLRESPALEILGRLAQRGAKVQAYDPAVHHDLDGIDVRDDPYAACEGAEVLAVLTEWDEFKWLDFDKVVDVMAAPRVVDARNLLDRASLVRRGFAYKGIGRA
ncbi:UDP-glucose/GDP-mannose dehydrogenase family protein [soil metagenome]